MTDQTTEQPPGDVLAAWDAEGEVSMPRIERKLPPRGTVNLTPTTPKRRAVLKRMWRAANRNPGITGPLAYEMESGGGAVLVPQEACRWTRSFLDLHGTAVHGLASAEWEAKWQSPA